MKRLVFGTSYVDNIERRETIRLWAKLMSRMAEGCDVMVIDSDSPMPVEPVVSPHKVFQFGNNVGHMNINGGQDGWGRAFCKGLELAIDGGYDQVACIDTDILFALPVAPIFDRMARVGVEVASPMDSMYWFIESGIMFFDVPWLKATNYIGRYDWQNPQYGTTNPERRCELAAGDDLFTLPIRGLRNDHGNITPDKLDAGFFPYGFDYLTHMGNFSLAWKFLEMNGLTDI